jgi:polysaccharide pyruvyl transferase CsaB
VLNVRYLVSGYYGEGNLGDEAILSGIIQEVRRRDPAAQFTVLSFSPEETRRRHQVEAHTTSLRRPWDLLRLMRRSHLLISGGGSFLHEADLEVYGRSFWWREGKLRPVPYFLGVVLLAQSCGLPALWYAQGLGPLYTGLSRRLVPRVAARSAALTWRDRDSAALAARLGAAGPLGAVVPDPAYALDPAPNAEAAGLLAGQGIEGEYVAVSPRPWLGRSGLARSLAAALSRLVQELGLGVVLVPFHPALDCGLCRQLAEEPGLRGRARILQTPEEPGLVAAVLGRARMCVTMRLHSGILAAAGGSPAAIIDYDPKVRAFARQTGQERWTVHVDELEAASGGERLAAVAMATARDAERRRAALARRVAWLRRDAGWTAGLAVQLAAMRRPA